jgi:tetratricopeptide (TPR) repeat protein
VVEVLRRASGWAALEDARRAKAGEPALSSSATPFEPGDLGPEQAWWLAALDGTTPAGASADPALAPLSYQADQAWAPLVSAADGWLARLHDGVRAAARGDWDAAAQAWRASILEQDNGWAWRNLAVAAERSGDHAAAADAYAAARIHLPQLLPLSIEAGSQLLAAGRSSDAIALIESLDAAQRADGRLRYALARASLDTGDLERCARLLEDGIEIADLKEGEASLDGLWAECQAARLAVQERVAVDDALRERAAREFPPPERYDFRMHVDG